MQRDGRTLAVRGVIVFFCRPQRHRAADARDDQDCGQRADQPPPRQYSRHETFSLSAPDKTRSDATRDSHAVMVCGAKAGVLSPMGYRLDAPRTAFGFIVRSREA
jgi:hypothetical protein